VPDNLTEVVELVKTNSTPSFGQLPSIRVEAVGAIFGNTPIICGGYDYGSYYDFADTCISYQDSQWTQSHSMNEERLSAAGVQINSTTFWILGGYHASSDHDSTEFIIEGQNNGVPGPKLPYKLSHMCAVKFSAQEIFVIGGNNRNEVWIYDPQNGFSINQGPSLNVGRYGHSCSTLRDGEKTLIVAAGGILNGGELGSVEIYDPTDNTWHSGPSLPYDLYYGAMAESPDGRGVLLFGGRSDENYYEHRILEMRAGANSWNILDVTLENGRSYHAVIPLQ